MRAPIGLTRGQTLVVLGVFAAPACATPIDEPVGAVEVPSFAGVGGDTAGTGGTSVAGMPGGGGKGGSGGAGGTGGTGGASGTSTGGAGTGGTSKGGTSAGMSAAGTTSGGRGGSTSGTGGASAGMTAMGGNGGKGGATNGGTGGNAGNGGSGAGSGGNGGSGGKGGTGTGGSGTTANGCAELSVPLNGSMDKAHFTISLNTPADLSSPGTTMSLRIYVEDGEGGRIFPYAQDADYNFLGPATADRALLAEQQGWETITWNVAAEPAGTSGIDKSNITRIGIEIQAAGSTSWSNPTIVFVDSISVDDPALSFGFGMSSSVSTSTNQTTDPTSQVLWLNADSADTTATGSEASWVATCP